MPIKFDSSEDKAVSVWTNPERQIALNTLVAYINWFEDNLRRPIISTLGLVPQHISKDWNKINSLKEDFANNREITEELLPITKTALLMAKQNESEVAEERSRQSLDPLTISSLQLKLATLDQILDLKKLKDQVPYVPPKITDYLSIHSAERALSQTENLQLIDRKSDDKFGILLAPDLFTPDLSYYRVVCSLRNVPLCVAYIDIDDLKIFNTTYSETHIDQHLLPKFMSAIEAHMYSHGSAYRYGGDEYVILMPNRDLEQAITHLDHLQMKIAELGYFEIAEKPTVSIGVIEVDDSIYKTTSEIEKLAVDAKNRAKEEGKNAIAYFDHGSVDPSKIEIVEK